MATPEAGTRLRGTRLRFVNDATTAQLPRSITIARTEMDITSLPLSGARSRQFSGTVRAGVAAGRTSYTQTAAAARGTMRRTQGIVPCRFARSVDLYEYQGKELFRRHGIPVSDGRLAISSQEAEAAARELGGAVVVKAQVLAGGRGKAGGIKLAEGPGEAAERARDILGLDIRGHV